MYTIKWSSQFKRQYKKFKHQVKTMNLIDEAITLLAKGEKLPISHYDHQLSGELQDYRECHIKPDLLLVYSYQKQELVLLLVGLGSHSELFG